MLDGDWPLSISEQIYYTSQYVKSLGMYRTILLIMQLIKRIITSIAMNVLERNWKGYWEFYIRGYNQ